MARRGRLLALGSSPAGSPRGPNSARASCGQAGAAGNDKVRPGHGAIAHDRRPDPDVASADLDREVPDQGRPRANLAWWASHIAAVLGPGVGCVAHPLCERKKQNDGHKSTSRHSLRALEPAPCKERARNQAHDVTLKSAAARGLAPKLAQGSSRNSCSEKSQYRRCVLSRYGSTTTAGASIWQLRSHRGSASDSASGWPAIDRLCGRACAVAALQGIRLPRTVE